MFKKYALIIFAVLSIAISYGNAQYMTNKIPHYLRAEYKEFYLNHPVKLNPLVKKVIGVPTPPEWAKYKPEVNRIQNGAGFELINITEGNNSQSETWIAINPKNPQNIIATANDNLYISGFQGYKMNSWYTLDGGKNWTASATPSNLGVYINKPSNNNMTIFDPGIAFDTEGRVVYTYGFTQITGKTSEDENGVFAVASTNGGASWDAWGKDFPISAIALSANESGNPFHDRYTLACDNVSETQYKNRFYITWQRFISNPGISFSYSDDFGQTWSNPVLIGVGASTQAPMPAVGPNGEVYVAWINNVYPDESQAIVLKSTNGGKNWGTSILAQRVTSIGTRHQTSGRFTLADKQGMRVSSPPQIAVDASSKSTRGYVYVVQAGRENTNGKYGIWVSKSTNGGGNWKKVRVDNSEIRNDMFFPSITVDPITGTVSVLYYSSQNDPSNNKGVDAYLSISQDGGETWNQLRLTPETWYIDDGNDVLPQGEDGNIYWGDYTSITSYNGIIYPLFWMPTASNGSFFSLDLFTVPISNNPAPIKDLTISNVYNTGKTSIKLSWTNPTIDLLGTPLGDFNVKIYREDISGDPIATVNKSQASEYVDNNVIDGKAYTYKLKVVLNDGRESVFASATIIAGGALKPNPPSNVNWSPLTDGIKLSWTNPDKSIDGLEVRELSAINIYLDGNLVKTFNQTQAQIGKTITEIINFKPNSFSKLKLTAVASRDGKTSESDFTKDFIVYAGQIYNIITENFDGQTVVPYYSENGWVLTSAKANSGQKAIGTTNGEKYSTSTNYELILPPMIVTTENQSLLFNHICLVHTTDVAQVSFSNDWCKSFKGSRWFTQASSSNFVKGDLGASNYELAAADLRPYIGDTVFVRFSLFSNAALTDLGWYIDDINFDNRVDVKEISPFEVNSLVISPNPANDLANIQFNLLSESSVQIEVIDLLGNQIKTINLGILENNLNNVQVDLNSVPVGTYYVRLVAGNSQIVRPLQITR